MWAYKNPKEADQKYCGSSYLTNLTGLIGTIFLWMYWPSFNGALEVGNGKSRAAINTTLSLLTSVCAAMLTSMALHKGKVNAEQVLNATLAGGVMMGSSCDMIVSPFISLCVGFVAGTISTLGFQFGPRIVYGYLKLHDTCGVFYLHFIPGILGGLLSGLIAGVSEAKLYGPDLNNVYSMMGPGHSRGHSVQGGIQIAALATTLGIGAVTGALTGAILRIPWIWNEPKVFFHDREYFEFAHRDHAVVVDIVDKNRPVEENVEDAEEVEAKDKTDNHEEGKIDKKN